MRFITATRGYRSGQRLSASSVIGALGSGFNGAGHKPVVGYDGTAPLRRYLAVFALSLLVIASALAVVYSSYKSRQLFSELQREHKQSMRLEEDWGRLLLEQSTWASPTRIEQLARERLKMVVPQPTDMVVVTE